MTTDVEDFPKGPRTLAPQGESKWDALVVGSGIAGLSCSKRLALAGQKVALVERNSNLGGHLLPFWRGGVPFEIGVHYLADLGENSLFFGALKKLKCTLQPTYLDSKFEELRFENGSVPFCYLSDSKLFFQSLRTQFPEQSSSLHKFESQLGDLWEFGQSLEFPFQKRKIVKQLTQFPAFFSLIHLFTKSAKAYLDHLGFTEELQEILLIHHVLIGVDPKKVSAAVHFLVLRYYLQNPGFIHGGGLAIRDALLSDEVQYFNGSGCQIEKRSSQMYPFRVRLDTGKSLLTKKVIWTPDPRIAQKQCSFSFPFLTHLKLNLSQNPHALVVGFFGTKIPLEDLGFRNANYWIVGQHLASQNYWVLDPIDLALKNTLYLSMGSLRDPTCLRLENKLQAKGLFQVMFVVPPKVEIWGGNSPELARVPSSKGGFGEHYRRTKTQILEILIRRLCQQFPALHSDVLVWKELGTPLTHQKYLHSVSLGGYGFAPTVSDCLFTRPSFKSGVENFYFAGAHNAPSHGILTSLLNGVGVAETILSQSAGFDG